MAVKNNFNACANNNTKPAKQRLMDNQDTAHKGDAGTDERKMITFYVSAKKHAALKAYCKQEGRTMTAVMQNAVDELLKEAENEDR